MLTNQTKKVQDLIQTLMSPRQAEKYIKILQDDIEALSTELTPKIATLRDLEIDYNNMRLNVNKLQEELDDNKRELENVVRQRDKRGKNENAHVMRPTSHLQSKKAKKVADRESTNWMGEFRTILEVEQRMMTAKQLADGFFRRYPAKKEDNFYVKGSMNARMNIVRTAEQVKERLMSSKQLNAKSAALLAYTHNDEVYYGPKEWFDGNFVPLPRYMQQFVYSNGNLQPRVQYPSPTQPGI